LVDDTNRDLNTQKHRLISFTNFNAQFLYSLTICVLHYNPPHVSSINMPILRRTNCIIIASGIVTFCKRLYGMPDERRALIRHTVLYCAESEDTRCCDNKICNIHIINEQRNCALKLVNEISLYYEARSKKHQNS